MSSNSLSDVFGNLREWIISFVVYRTNISIDVRKLRDVVDLLCEGKSALRRGISGNEFPFLLYRHLMQRCNSSRFYRIQSVPNPRSDLPHENSSKRSFLFLSFFSYSGSVMVGSRVGPCRGAGRPSTRSIDSAIPAQHCCLLLMTNVAHDQHWQESRDALTESPLWENSSGSSFIS